MTTWTERNAKTKKHWIVELTVRVYYAKNLEDSQDVHHIIHHIKSINLKNAQHQANILARTHRAPIMTAGWGGIQNFKHKKWYGRDGNWYRRPSWECERNAYRQQIRLRDNIDADLQARLSAQRKARTAWNRNASPEMRQKLK